MSKKIIGVTVGTPLSPAKIAEKIKPVKTVNGVAPDKNGNVRVGFDTALSEIVDAVIKELPKWDGGMY